MAVGFENCTFDERICYVHWKGFVLGTAKLIDHIRIRHNAYFRSFRRLHYRRMTNPELALRWQRRGRPLRRAPIPLTLPSWNIEAEHQLSMIRRVVKIAWLLLAALIEVVASADLDAPESNQLCRMARRP